MTSYDAVIVGFGKAGKTLAATLAKADWNVAIIEQSLKMYGGTCINIACIPTKTLLHDSNIPRPTDVSFPLRYENAIERKGEVTSTLRNKNFKNLDDSSNVMVYTGHARFTDSKDIEITAGEEMLTVHGEKIFINTGTEPRIPSIEGVENSQFVYTSTSLMELTDLPERLAIIGGGNVGLEFATIYQQFGADVTVLSSDDRLLKHEDTDVAAAVQSELESLGIQFVFNTTVKQVEDLASSARISFETPAGLTRIEAEAILVATGRSPVTQDLGLESIGVERDDRGYIKVDSRLRTSVDNVWALGDINGGPQFTYISLDDYRIVKDQLLGDGKRSTDDRKAVPTTQFFNPPLARVGMTEDEARKAGHDVAVATLPVAAIPRARVNNDTRGILKAVVDKQTKLILGVALFCTNAEEIINIVAIAMSLEQEYSFLRDRIYTHPTMSEALNDLFSTIDDQ